MKMRFNLVTALDTSTNTESPVWFGNHALYEAQSGTTSEVIVGDEKRLMLTGLLSLAKIYTDQLSRRRELGHDCAVFAYSWESGDTYDTVRALRAGGLPLIPRILERLSDDLTSPPLTQPGEIVYTVNTPVAQASEMQPDPHFMVHATVDNGDPLYLSKFGRKGPIMLTSFDQSLQLFPAQTSGVARDFGAVL